MITERSRWLTTLLVALSLLALAGCKQQQEAPNLNSQDNQEDEVIAAQGNPSAEAGGQINPETVPNRGLAKVQPTALKGDSAEVRQLKAKVARLEAAAKKGRAQKIRPTADALKTAKPKLPTTVAAAQPKNLGQAKPNVQAAKTIQALNVAKLPMKGNPNAAVTILEFSDFQCPFCGRVNPTIAQILKTYPNDVRVVFVQMPLAFHKDAPLAGQASLAAHAQGKFWEYHDKLFANQKAIKRPDLDRYAQELGLNMVQFKADLDGGKFKAAVDAQMASSQSLGIRGTPNFLINGVPLTGAQPFPKFKAVIDAQLAAAKTFSAEKGLKGEALHNEIFARNFTKAPARQKPPAAAGGGPRSMVDIGSSPVLGDPNAPITLIEFSDFECPFCTRGANTVKELLKNNPGKVKIIFKHNPLPFHKNARLAHKASIAAQQQGKFWEYHDLLFANRKALTRPDLERYAQQVGLNMAKFTADLDNPAFDKIIEADMAAGQKVAVRGTPHFFMNGTRIKGAQPITSFQSTLDAELKIVAKYTAKGIPANKLYETIVKSEKSAAPAPAAKKPAAAPTGPIKPLNMAQLPMKGNADAIVTIVEFSDFECPFCSRVNPTIDQIMKTYPTEVRVVFAQMPLPFHKNAPLAGQASLAANAQGKFWAYHDKLFANQKALTRPDLDRYAQELELNMAQFKADLDSGKFKAAVDAQTASAQSMGIRGTPNFLINGVPLTGAQPFPKFKAVIDAQLAAAKTFSAEKGLKGEALHNEIFARNFTKAPARQKPPAAAGGGPRSMVDIGSSPVLGDPNAPITLIEFSDFECPFCTRGANTVKELLKNNPGKVKIIFKHNPLPFHKNARLAHKASIAAQQQGKFWEYHDLLFANRKALTRPDLERYAQQVGLNMAKFTADLDNPAFDKIIEADMAAGQKVAVRGTPHFFMNGTRIKGAQPITSFQSTLDAELKIVAKYTAKGIPANKLYETIIKSEKPAPGTARPTPPPAPTGPVFVDTKGSPFKGAANAPVTIVEFSDFQCPFCSRVNPTIDQIMKTYPGKVKVVFKQMPLAFHKDAPLAAEATLAANAQGKFWEFHDKLFANQKAIKRPDLDRYAQELGLNMAQFKADLDSGKYKAAVAKDMADAQKAGIRGTPNFLINGERLTGAQPFDKFKAVIDAKLAAGGK